MATIFKSDDLRGLSVASAHAESARKAIGSRLKMLATFLGTNLTESFASNIQDLWDFAGSSESVNSLTLATKFPQWKLETHHYNTLSAWSCSMVEITDIRTEVLSCYGIPNEAEATKDELGSIETWMVTQATKAKWNLTLFRVPSLNQMHEGSAVLFVVHDNNLGESTFAISEGSKLFKVLPPMALDEALSQEVRSKSDWTLNMQINLNSDIW
jgi:hypothetical protein